MSNKRIISIILVWAIVFTGISTISYGAQAKTKAPVLSSKKVVLKKGKTKTIKLKNVRQKVQWKVVSGRKNAKIVKKSGKYNNKIKLKAVKKGNAVLVAVHGKKIYTLKATVTDKKVIVPESTTKPEEETTTKVEQTTEKEEVEYAKVTFLGLDENIVCTMEYQKGKPYGSFPLLYEDGFALIGWRKENSEGKVIWKNDICEGDITLWADFIRVRPTEEPTYEIVEE